MERPRAIFSINDIELIKKLLLEKLGNTAGMTEEKIKALSALYHRLGRM